MASGLPDYHRGVDIKLQSLSELTSRPKYGAAKGILSSRGVTASAGTYLVEVLGKGMIYGGSVWLDYTSTQANSELWVVCDDEAINALSFFRLKEYGIDDPRNSPVSVNKFDGTNHVYSVGISYGITFEESLRLLYWEKYGKTPVVHYHLVYALI